MTLGPDFRERTPLRQPGAKAFVASALSNFGLQSPSGGPAAKAQRTFGQGAPVAAPAATPVSGGSVAAAAAAVEKKKVAAIAKAKQDRIKSAKQVRPKKKKGGGGLFGFLGNVALLGTAGVGLLVLTDDTSSADA